MAEGLRFQNDLSCMTISTPREQEATVITRPYVRVAAAALVLVMTALAGCKSRPPDLTVLTASPEQITYEVPIESPLFSGTRAPAPKEVIAAAEKYCAQYRKKALFVRVIQRATNMQNITYDCVAP